MSQIPTATHYWFTVKTLPLTEVESSFIRLFFISTHFPLKSVYFQSLFLLILNFLRFYRSHLSRLVVSIAAIELKNVSVSVFPFDSHFCCYSPPYSTALSIFSSQVFGSLHDDPWWVSMDPSYLSLLSVTQIISYRPDTAACGGSRFVGQWLGKLELQTFTDWRTKHTKRWDGHLTLSFSVFPNCSRVRQA